jgi:hypothetical protein
LDSTLRRGFEKEYSPKNVRFVKDFTEDEDKSVRSGNVLNASPPTIAEEVLVIPPIASSNLSAALLRDGVGSSSGLETTEIKKAFTEFHNSSKYAKDSTSAYLGDEPSVRENQLLASLYKPSQDKIRKYDTVILP